MRQAIVFENPNASFLNDSKSVISDSPGKPKSVKKQDPNSGNKRGHSGQSTNRSASSEKKTSLPTEHYSGQKNKRVN
jgi:hypothetical protein